MNRNERKWKRKHGRKFEIIHKRASKRSKMVLLIIRAESRVDYTAVGFATF